MTNLIRRAVKPATLRSILYSEPVRGSARRVVNAPLAQPARALIDRSGYGRAVRRFTSPSLPPGVFYAKLTIKNWERHVGQNFILRQGGVTVFGNQIEPPANGFPLEYRNIIVTSRDLREFTLDIDSPYSLAIGQGSFTTSQQVAYDQRYGVEQHGDVFYSLRGNTRSPKKILVTFPGFGTSTGRVSYAVSYMKDLTDKDLKNTLMICFQDRYLVSGSYMMVDSAGVPLYDRVHRVIEGFRAHHKIADSDILFFGASKGGSIAIQYAKEFPKAHLLLAVPQMSLPYYFSKPFFKENLYRVPELRELPQPEDLLRQYMNEGRRIDYFYTNTDELSNHSLIEMIEDVPNLTKYRVGGVHGAVARAALPAMLGIIRRFLGGGHERPLVCEEVRTYPADQSLRVQARLESVAAVPAESNWFLEGALGRTRFLHMASGSVHDFVKYTTPEESLSLATDPIAGLSAITAVDPAGNTWSAPLPHGLIDSPAEHVTLPCAPLSLEQGAVHEHAILHAQTFGRFRYVINPQGRGGAIEIYLVDALDSSPNSGSGSRDAPLSDAQWTADVESSDRWTYVDLLALRLAVAADATQVRVVVLAETVGPSAILALARMEWADAVILVPESHGVWDSGNARAALDGMVVRGRVTRMAGTGAHVEDQLSQHSDRTP